MQNAKFQEIVRWVKDSIAQGALSNMDKLPTENELSEKFGVSRQTVRRALECLVSEGIVTKIQGSGTYIGQPTEAPKVQREATKNIAVISTYFDQYIFPGVLRGMENALTANGYILQLHLTNDSIHHEKTILNNLIQRNDVDGIIAEPAKSGLPNPNLPLYQKLIDMGIPVLFFHSKYPGLPGPCVRIDDEAAARSVTRYLIDAGHKSIAGIFHAEDGQGRLRYAGYLNELWSHHYRTNDKMTIWLDSDLVRDLSKAADYIFDSISEATAVVCYNDEIAYQLVNLAIKRGISVPGELSVIGIDDSKLGSMCEVPITSYVHPKEELGRRVGENMIEMLENPLFDADYLFETGITERKSVAAPHKDTI